VSRAEFEANLAGKMRDPVFHGDLGPLLAAGSLVGAEDYDPETGYRRVHAEFISRLRGDAWKGVR
jgi:hypothetical protein